MGKIIKSVDCPRETFKPGDVLFKEDTPADGFFIVKRGEIEVYKGYGTPNKVLLAVIGEGKVLGEIAGIDGLPRSATAVAKTPVEVTRVATSTLAYQLKECPAWFRAIIKDLVARLRNADEILVGKGGPAEANTVSSQKDSPDAKEA